MTQRLSPEECTSRYCACCPASKDSFLTQFDDITQYNTCSPSSGGNWPRSPTATAAWQSQCLQKPLKHYHTKQQNHLPAPGLGIKTAPSSKAMNQQCCSWVVQPISLKILPAARQVFTSNLLVDSWPGLTWKAGCDAFGVAAGHIHSANIVVDWRFAPPSMRVFKIR